MASLRNVFGMGRGNQAPAATPAKGSSSDEATPGETTIGGRTTPTQRQHESPGGYFESPHGSPKEPQQDLKIDIPGSAHGGAGQRGGSPATADVLPAKKTKNRHDTNALKKAPPRLANRSSFHSRDSFFLSQWQSGNPSPYVPNSGHYSQQGETYHRRSFGSGVSPFAMSSISQPTTPAKHGQDSSASSEYDVGHARGPTALGLADMKSDASKNQQQALAQALSQHRDSVAVPGFSAANSHWRSTEEIRLEEDERKEKYWRRWGPYVSERQWATVREDYSSNGDAWSHFPHEHARSRAYRWGEDGLAGICDNHCRMAFTLGLWNGKDRMLKERMFGLANNQGNHGEDVKELYWYLDNTPTHSYQKMLYKYPQESFPYEQLVRESQNRSRDVAEFEITDTDLFDENRYWDIFVEYAKDADEENATSIRITAYNRGPEPADLHIIPQLFFRNTWSWPANPPPKPEMKLAEEYTIQADHESLGRYFLYCSTSPAPSRPARRRNQAPELISDDEIVPEMLFTENETNFERLYGGHNVNTYAKDAFHDHIVPQHRMEKDRPQPVRKTRTVTKTITKTIKKKVPVEAASKGSIKGKPNGSTKVNGTSDHAEAEDEDAFKEVEEEVEEQVEEEEEYFETPTDVTPPRDYVNPEKKGTKSAAHYTFKEVPANGGCVVVRLKLTPRTPTEDPAVDDDEKFDAVMEARRSEADEFYSKFSSGGATSDDMKSIMRQALAGMLWCKQFYMFVQPEWLKGDPAQPPPPPERKHIRNKEWRHLHMEDILSMPDKWEYPFPAVWDTAFHCIPLAMIDPSFAKKQLDLFTREWYMKPDGALPAYEWNFSDVNPPVHAWSTFRVFKIERKLYGREDLDFLERVFQKLLINFTWWVNRKDSSGSNVFEGGFLGLDNIGPFNRSEPLPTGGTLRQADGTAWMAFYALNMLNMALELAKHNPTYEDIASKFFEHFIFISDAMTYRDQDDEGLSLWSEEDGFYYDAIQWGPGNSQVIPVKSLVGLIPLYATLTIEPSALKRFPSFAKRMQWFLDNRPEMSQRNIANMSVGGKGDRRLLAMVSRERLERILKRMLDETEFLSEFGVRSLSKDHKDHPFKVNIGGEDFGVGYWPGDSHSPMFGGNSNWRGPVWYAVNFLLVESLQRFYQYYGEDFKIECPTGSGDFLHLGHVAEELQHRLISIFVRDDQGRRATNGGVAMLDYDPHFREHVHFYEFFHGDTGKGLGASHQTGWTGLVAYSIMSAGMSYKLPRTPRTPRSTAAHYFDENLTDADGKSDGGSQYSHSATYSRPPSPDEL